VEKTQDTVKKTKKAKPVLKKISTVFFILLFTFIIVCIGSIITTKAIYHKPAALFGFRIVKILTDSMSPEIAENSYILVKNIEGADVKEGDIVVHTPAYGDYAGTTMTHKCIRGPEVETEGIAAGKTCILTQGTKEGAPVDAPVPIANVQSVFVCKIARAGSFFDFLTSIWGVMVMVALPSLVVIVLQVIRMVRAVLAKPDEDAVKAEAERIGQEQRSEMLAALMRDANSASESDKVVSDVGDLGDVMAYIAREKAKNTAESTSADAPKSGDEMSSVMAFIAREKAKQTGADCSPSAVDSTGVASTAAEHKDDV
jgi:signal peptidase